MAISRCSGPPSCPYHDGILAGEEPDHRRARRRPACRPSTRRPWKPCAACCGEARYKTWNPLFRRDPAVPAPGSCLEAGHWLLRLSLAEQVPAWQPPQSHDPRERVLLKATAASGAMLCCRTGASIAWKVLDDDWVRVARLVGRQRRPDRLRQVEDDEGRGQLVKAEGPRRRNCRRCWRCACAWMPA